MKKSLPSFLLLLLLSGTALRAQQRSLCIDDSLRLTTAYDRYTHTLLADGDPDPNWTVISGPGGTNLSFPTPARVIAQYSGWHYTLPGSKWISPYAFADYSTNNLNVPYVFRYSFCLAQQTVIDLNLIALDDDVIALYLDGQYVDTVSMGYNFYDGGQDTFHITRTLAAGTHNLDINLYNVGGIAMGLNVQGYITSLYGLQTDTCCFTNGSANGSAYRDHNGDGVRDKGTSGTPVDEGLPGWQVELTDGGSNSFHKTTDIHGDYSFMNIAPGSYMLHLSNPSGTPYSSTPVTIGKHTVSLKELAVNNGAATSIHDEEAEQAYFKAYPNPASTLLQMDYYMASAATVSMTIANTQGQAVIKVINEEAKGAGAYHQTINVSQLPAGVYFYQLTTDRVYNGKFVKQ